MADEKKLTFQFVGSIVITILFFYFSWSASKWTEHVETTLVTLQTVDADRAPRMLAVELEIKNLRQSNNDLKLAFDRLNDKIDRILEIIQFTHDPRRKDIK